MLARHALREGMLVWHNHSVGNYKDQLQRLQQQRKQIREQLAETEAKMKLLISTIPYAGTPHGIAQDDIGIIIGLRRLAVAQWRSTGTTLADALRNNPNDQDITQNYGLTPDAVARLRKTNTQKQQ